MSTAEIVPSKGEHVLYVWVVDWEGDGSRAYNCHAPYTLDGDDHKAALNGDPRTRGHADQSKVRAALVKITVPLTEMRRVGADA